MGGLWSGGQERLVRSGEPAGVGGGITMIARSKRRKTVVRSLGGRILSRWCMNASQSTVNQTIDGVEQPVNESGPDLSATFDRPTKVTCSATTLVLDAGSDDEFPVQRQ